MPPLRFWTIFVILVTIGLVIACFAWPADAATRKVPCAESGGPCIVRFLPGNIFYYDYPPNNKSSKSVVKKPAKKVVVKINHPYIAERRLPPVPTFPKAKH